MTKSNFRRKAFIWLAVYSLSLAGSQGWNLEAETEAKTMKECHLLPDASWLSRFVFLNTQDYLSRGGKTQREPGHSVSVTSHFNN